MSFYLKLSHPMYDAKKQITEHLPVLLVAFRIYLEQQVGKTFYWFFFKLRMQLCNKWKLYSNLVQEGKRKGKERREEILTTLKCATSPFSVWNRLIFHVEMTLDFEVFLILYNTYDLFLKTKILIDLESNIFGNCFYGCKCSDFTLKKMKTYFGISKFSVHSVQLLPIDSHRFNTNNLCCTITLKVFYGGGKNCKNLRV